jgi:hypothetical protein
VPFLLGLADAAEVGREQVVTLQTAELFCEFTLVRTGALDDGDLAVVVADAAGHPAEEGEGGDMAGVEGLGTFAGIGHGKACPAVGQGEDEERSLKALSGDDDGGVAVVALGLAGRMAQGDEDLGLRLLEGAHGLADDAGTAAIVMLVAEAIEDASGGMALLGGRGLILVENLLNDGEERSENRAWPWLGLLVGLGFGLVNDLVDGAEVEVVLPAGLPETQLAAADPPTDLRPKFHVGEHSCLPLSGPRCTLSVAVWRSGALHFSVGTALHFSVGVYICQGAAAEAPPTQVERTDYRCGSPSHHLSR